MNRLQLCQELIDDCGITGAMTTTIGQTGEFATVVRMIDEAYEDVQNEHSRWEFLKFTFTFSTVAAAQTYTPAAAGVSDLAEWKTWGDDTFRVYTGAGTNEIYLHFVPWDLFRQTYLFSGNRTTTGLPVLYTVRPDQSLMFWPIPNAIFTVEGEYWKRPQVMAANVDEPLFPARFHRIIKAKARMAYGANESSSEDFSKGELDYKKLFSKLRRDQLPAISIGATLA